MSSNSNKAYGIKGSNNQLEAGDITVANSIYYISQNQDEPPAKKQKFKSIQFDLRKPIINFTGREKELIKLHDILQKERGLVAVTQMTSVSGLGGVGKSELVIKYANDYKKDYDENVVWINAETHESIKNSFHRLAEEELKISINEKKDGKEQEREVKSLVRDIYRYFRNRKSLFIFDNAEEFKSISQLLPVCFNLNPNKPYVLITSRNRQWDEVVDLDVLSSEDAAQFIREALKFMNDYLYESDINQLAGELQCYPLALRQASSYIREINKKRELWGEKKFTINDYIEEYRKNAESLLSHIEPNYVIDPYSKTTLITWSVTIENIRNNGEYGQEALTILTIMAYIAPDQVHVEKLFTKLIEDKDKLRSAVELLSQYSMINLEKGVSNIHRLVQKVMRIQIKKQSEEEKVLGEALEILSSENGNDIHIISIWDYASEYNNLINKHLNSKYGYNNDNLLYFLARNGCSKAINSILAHLECNSHSFSVIHNNNNYGETLLHIAALNCEVDVVKHLVEKGAYFNAQDKEGKTPLQYAADSAYYYNQDTAKYLVEKGADFNAQDKEGKTPLHNAALRGELGILKYLVENGADFKAQDKEGKTPLHNAALRGKLDVVKHLVEKGVDFDVRDKYGKTPLHNAVYHGKLNIVKYLVEKGADFNAQGRRQDSFT